MIRSNGDWWLETVGGGLPPSDFEKQKQHLINGAYQEFSKSEPGEIILHDLFDFCGMDKVNYSNDFKPETLAFLEGQRSVLLRILQRSEFSQLALMSKKKKEQKNEG